MFELSLSLNLTSFGLSIDLRNIYSRTLLDDVVVCQVAETNIEELESHMLPYVLLLHAFCVVDPTLCAPATDPSQFIITLQPYLKSQVKKAILVHKLFTIYFILQCYICNSSILLFC